MPRPPPSSPPRSPQIPPARSWPSDEDRVDGQASGPPVGPSPDSDARERARRPRYGDADCLFCAGSGQADGQACPECNGTGRSLPATGSE